ncbi:MAG TPA: arsenosugar biosynthesis radical SAM (seleno)protein ArsS [Gemmatimonadales bacterium]|nr:arsenosugar biosynthesis radical SAM (seleno)protein ArsS [Gemmatimonadales bacterium]
MPVLPTLQKQRHPLAGGAAQRRRLAEVPLARSFEAALEGAGLHPLRAAGLEVLQINVGRKCNQTCHHCHVDAGPDRTEIMPAEIVDRCLEVLAATAIPTLDITGGAPELHPAFRRIVETARGLGRHVMDRCNLTITRLPNYRYLPSFLAEHRVEIVASLPYFQARQTDAQRGDGVFHDSIAALRELNALGYGVPGTGLLLNLVTNPVGAFLPPAQAAAERDWRRELDRRHGVVFNRLFTITNMPISRFLEYLDERGQTEAYLARLVEAFNPAAAAGVMCRTMLSVSWDGTLHDCDFNQMLDLGLESGLPRHIRDFDEAALGGRTVALGPHCFGCSAGGGSSCGGATVGAATHPEPEPSTLGA